MSLPAWPEPLPPLTDTPRALPVWHARTIAERDYERSRYLAAMARLRVAVEALERIAGWTDPDEIAGTALTAIGPLPAEQQPGRGE